MNVKNEFETLRPSRTTVRTTNAVVLMVSDAFLNRFCLHSFPSSPQLFFLVLFSFRYLPTSLPQLLKSKGRSIRTQTTILRARHRW